MSNDPNADLIYAILAEFRNSGDRNSAEFRGQRIPGNSGDSIPISVAGGAARGAFAGERYAVAGRGCALPSRACQPRSIRAAAEATSLSFGLVPERLRTRRSARAGIAPSGGGGEPRPNRDYGVNFV